MVFKKIIGKVKDKHNQLKEKIEQERKVNSKANNIILVDPNIDVLRVDDSSKKGIDVKNDLFIEKINSNQSTNLKTYTIEKDDTLKLISKKIYHDDSKWIMIHRANIKKIPNPSKLIVGMILELPHDGKTENFYPINSNSKNYIIQPEDNINLISEKIFGHRAFAKKVIRWDYVKFTKDIYAGKEIIDLKYQALEHQLIELANKYNIKYKNVLIEQKEIILNSIACISRENKIPPVVMMSISNIDNYWQNIQLGKAIDFKYCENIGWQPMMLDDHLYSNLFPKAAMNIEFNITSTAQILGELKKTQKNWSKSIISFYLESALGIGKPEEQVIKTKIALKIIDRIINQMNNKDFCNSVKTKIISVDAHDISFELLYNELIMYKEFFSNKYL
ncbi:MAG: hypothetical protein H7263_03800 [Candidatus Sericytochromatia bacterium]|nr:hypothetical protein [Candidatus Sericytochromatia bacterium]